MVAIFRTIAIAGRAGAILVLVAAGNFPLRCATILPGRRAIRLAAFDRVECWWGLGCRVEAGGGTVRKSRGGIQRCGGRVESCQTRIRDVSVCRDTARIRWIDHSGVCLGPGSHAAVRSGADGAAARACHTARACRACRAAVSEGSVTSAPTRAARAAVRRTDRTGECAIHSVAAIACRRESRLGHAAANEGQSQHNPARTAPSGFFDDGHHVVQPKNTNTGARAEGCDLGSSTSLCVHVGCARRNRKCQKVTPVHPSPEIVRSASHSAFVWNSPGTPRRSKLEVLAVFNMGMSEIALVLFLALIFLGPHKLPELASGLGKMIREVRKATADIKNEIELDETIRKPLQELRDATMLPPEELKRRDIERKERERWEKEARERELAAAAEGATQPATEGLSPDHPDHPEHHGSSYNDPQMHSPTDDDNGASAVAAGGASDSRMPPSYTNPLSDAFIGANPNDLPPGPNTPTVISLAPMPPPLPAPTVALPTFSSALPLPPPPPDRAPGSVPRGGTPMGTGQAPPLASLPGVLPPPIPGSVKLPPPSAASRPLPPALPAKKV